MSHNILDGGIGRADPIAEVILAQRADVVVLVEADDPEVRDRIAWRLGYDCVAGVGRKGRTAAILTRGRIAESINHVALGGKDLPRSMLSAVVRLDDIELPVMAVHLSSKASDEREAKREREVATVLKALAPLRKSGTPHVICGDFNAVSPHADVTPASLPDKVRPHFKANGKTLPRRAIATLLDAGYADTLDDPAAVSFTTLQPGLRLDYIFGHGLSKSSGWVEQDRLARYASDHFPVGAELWL